MDGFFIINLILFFISIKIIISVWHYHPNTYSSRSLSKLFNETFNEPKDYSEPKMNLSDN
ncbi:hypothetical protein A3Q34_14240 [Colwellia sp. PAMC 20917]|nr:hypothetical protein A3Q34_14240 [Colwellia sp. PAMC 20917]